MIKTLTKHGNSLALVIDKPILELLHIEADTPISISTDGKSLTLSPVVDPERAEKLMQIRHKINEKYKSTFERLAN
ncbi:AbrB/MazE/SpoVT family DNA-binding domain-containing protein [Synergistaceae bacterium OttesenSCG-928-D05]|nr:AbrB/MazE/SpoVT family DNA-binding domain-containing protein [Synergistaceae bacterium OttesenSCG-928-D05]